MCINVRTGDELYYIVAVVFILDVRVAMGSRAHPYTHTHIRIISEFNVMRHI